MNKGKLIILFLALLLPIVIFIFLKSFGKNEFEVKPLFQDSISLAERCASNRYEIPYTVADSITTKLLNKDDSLTVIVFEDPMASNNKVLLTQINRLQKETLLTKIWYVSEKEGNEINAKVLKLDSVEYMVMRECIFLLKSSDCAVLLDAKRRIIGQYNLLDLDEADRLIMEIKIILKQY